MKESGFSRIPVYRVRVDEIVGYVSAYDLIDKKPQEPIKKYIRSILIFSEYTPLQEVINKFNYKKEHMGVVVDERGAIIGIITLEDIVKEIIGEIHGDSSNGELIKEISKDKWIVDGKLELSEFVRMTGLRIPAGNYSTIGGYIAHLKGGIPSKGEVLRQNGYIFKVVEADDRRVKKILVERA
jgi:CBS domain containing-hemolysin-like protein